jgi:hypothetical protein
MGTGSQVKKLALPIAILAGIVFAWGGPWLVGHRDRPAREPFGFALPDGFHALPPDPSVPQRKAWTHAPLGNDQLTPNLTLTHVNDMSNFDDAKLSEIASGMPAFFAKSKIKWTEVRHAQVKRRDGALVSLLEGENEIADEHFRSLQLTFPDNTGVSLITANFPTSEASHWEPIFEATIESSKGVATRGVTSPLWMRAAWGGGAALLAFLVVLGWTRKPETDSPSLASTSSGPGPVSSNSATNSAKTAASEPSAASGVPKAGADAPKAG